MTKFKEKMFSLGNLSTTACKSLSLRHNSALFSHPSTFAVVPFCSVYKTSQFQKLQDTTFAHIITQREVTLQSDEASAVK